MSQKKLTGIRLSILKYSRLRFSQLYFSTSTKMRRIIGHAVAGTMFLTISVWWPFYLAGVLQMNRRNKTLRTK